MTKIEIQTFIEEMESIGDPWTEEEVERCYGDVSLHEALQSRKSLVNLHLSSIATAFLSSSSFATNEPEQDSEDIDTEDTDTNGSDK